MKLQSIKRSTQSAFTLIELLVVIAIIAILATIAVPAGAKVMEKAKILQAKTAMKGLEIAINGYRTEYNRFPLASGATGDTDYETDSSGITLLNTLMAADNTNNPRQIRFYEPATAKGNMNGYVENEGLFDPWGIPYKITIDYANNGILPNPYAGQTMGGGTEPENVSTSIIIRSAGPDETWDTKDDVTSWH